MIKINTLQRTNEDEKSKADVLKKEKESLKVTVDKLNENVSKLTSEKEALDHEKQHTKDELKEKEQLNIKLPQFRQFRTLKTLGQRRPGGLQCCQTWL